MFKKVLVSTEKCCKQ